MGIVTKMMIDEDVKKLTEKQKGVLACCYLEQFTTIERIELLDKLKREVDN